MNNFVMLPSLKQLEVTATEMQLNQAKWLVASGTQKTKLPARPTLLRCIDIMNSNR